MQTIYLDISNRGVISTIYAKQGDVGREFLVILTDAGVPYIPPGGSVFSVWYNGSSGEGNYTDVGTSSAFVVSANTVRVELITQMLQNEGSGNLCLMLNKENGDQISSWNISYVCEAVPGYESEEAKSYFTAFSNAVKNLPYPDTSLSAPGKAADAAATGKALDGKAPAVEDANFPGCYYRMAGGVKEWLNPPMALGVEYRTTERDNGKVVYAKKIDFGALPNATYKAVAHGSSLTKCIRYSLVNKHSSLMLNGHRNILVNVDATVVQITTNTDLSAHQAWCVIWYTKD